MMHQNCCVFTKIEDGRISNSGEKCGLYFRNLLELIHHIEEEHIPLIENAKMVERARLREQFANDPEQYEKAYFAFLNQPVPLSLICKLKPFPKGYKVRPITPPKQRTLKFCHYKPTSQQWQPSHQQQTLLGFNDGNQALNPSLCSEIMAGSNIPLSKTVSKKTFENRGRIRDASTSSECATPDMLLGAALSDQQMLINADDKKYRCSIDGCSKMYKNSQGLRQHMRNVHNTSVEAGLTKLSASEEGILSRQLPGRQSPFVLPSLASVLLPSSSSSPLMRYTATEPVVPSKTVVLQQEQSSSSFLAGIPNINTNSIAPPSAAPILIREQKYQCQYCVTTGSDIRIFKSLAALNKHLRDVHGAITLSPSSSHHNSRYSSPAPPHQRPILINSPQQSPQRPISTGSSQLQMGHSQYGSSSSTFVSPTISLSSRQQQQSSSFSASSTPNNNNLPPPPHIITRPSAPVPPSTPPPFSSSSVGGGDGSSPNIGGGLIAASPSSFDCFPSQQQQQQQLLQTPQSMRRQSHFVLGAEHGSPQHHYYVTTTSGHHPSALLDAQPPVLQPQQQQPAAAASLPQRFLRYTYQQQQQQQIEKQQHLFSSTNHETAPSAAYASSSSMYNHHQGGPTDSPSSTLGIGGGGAPPPIYMTHQQQQQQHPSSQHNFIIQQQQMECDQQQQQQQESYGRTALYRQQAPVLQQQHYVVESSHLQQQQQHQHGSPVAYSSQPGAHHHQLLQQQSGGGGGNRLVSSSSASNLRAMHQHHHQQQQQYSHSQQQQHGMHHHHHHQQSNQTLYSQPRENFPRENLNQQPYNIAAARTAQIQVSQQQRIFPPPQQHHQFYNQPRVAQFHGARRQSPETVAEVLGEASAQQQQGAGSTNIFDNMGQHTRQK